MTDLHRDAVVVDCHNDLILTVARKRALGVPDHFGEYWLPELRSGGVDVQVVPLYVEDEYVPEGALRRTLLLAELLLDVCAEHADAVALCRTGEEIDGAVAAGKIAMVMALEGCAAIGTDVELFETFFRLGLRMASFTHFGRTALADGSGEDGTGGRLARAGVAAVTEMQRLGIVVDVSHLSMAGTAHVLELATRPVIASHSSSRALVDHHRNLHDEVVKQIAATGGVVGINLFPGFIDTADWTIERAVDHIERVASVAGIDHVGVGPDFIREYADEMYPNYPHLQMEGLTLSSAIEGLSFAHDLPNLTAALVRRGFSEPDVRKVLGENFLRVFRLVMGVPGRTE